MEDSHLCGASVIVPVYQSRQFLSRCIESILGQTFSDLELLLVDDGSTDGSGEICEEYARKDRRVKVIHQANQGVSAARNAGLRICGGEYIYFADADDYVDLHMVEDTRAAMKEKEADIAVFNADQVKNGAGPQPFGWHMESPVLYGEESVRRAGLCQLFSEVWRKAYHRSLREALLFPESLSCYEDMPVNTDVWCHAEKTVLLPGKAYYFYERSPHESLLQSGSQRNLWQSYEVWRENIRVGTADHMEAPLLSLYGLRRKEAAAHVLWADSKSTVLTQKQADELADLLSIVHRGHIINSEMIFLEFCYAWRANRLTADLLGSGYPLVNQRLFRSAVHLYAADSVMHRLEGEEKHCLEETLCKISRNSRALGIRRISDRLLCGCMKMGLQWLVRQKGRQLLER